MNVTRKAHAVLLIAAGLVGALTTTACGGDDPAPAVSQPEQQFEGTYLVTAESGWVVKWTITSCGAGCADIEASPEKAAPNETLELPYTGQARVTGDEWSLSTLRTDGYICADGTEVAVDAIYTWNTVSFKGSWDAKLHEPGCGNPAGSGTGAPESFTLSKDS